MRKMMTIAAVAVGLAASPAMAQDEPQPPRTTYELRFMDIADGKGQRFEELVDKYFRPARKAAGLPDFTIHWLMTGDYDILVPMVMPRGMASFDTHGSPERAAVAAEVAKIAGGEDEAKKIFDEMGEIVVKTKSVYSHTHP